MARRIRDLGRPDDLRDAIEKLIIEFGKLCPPCIHLFDPLQLGKTQGGLKVCQVVFPTRLKEIIVPGGFACITFPSILTDAVKAKGNETIP